MGRTRELTIVIAGDAAGANRTFDSVERRSQGLGDRMARLGRNMTAAVTLPVIAGGVAIFNMASNLNETISMVDTIFGDSAASIQSWSQTTAETMGMAREDSLRAAGGFGNLFTQLGLGTEQAAGMSTALVGLATDFASFHNANPVEVVDAMTAAFRGEYDALQRFVPTINAAAVEQKALEMGLADATGAIDDQDRALATQTLMFDGAGSALGDFERTADSAANQQKTLTAEFKDAAGELGTNLLPIAQDLLGWLGGLLEKFNGLSDGQQRMILIVIGLAAVIGPLVGVITAVSTAAAFLAANPIVMLIAALALLAFVVWQNWDAIKTFFAGGIEWVKGVLSDVGEWIANNWPLLLAPLTGGISLIVGQIIEHWDGIVSFVTGLPGRISDAAHGMWDGLSDAFRAAVNFIIRGWNSIEFRIPGFGVGPIRYGGFTLGLPDIDQLAQGGITTGPMLALVGDNRSGREAIIPLERAGEFGLGAGNRRGDTTFNITLTGAATQADGRLVRRAVIDALAEHERRDGRLPLRSIR